MQSNASLEYLLLVIISISAFGCDSKKFMAINVVFKGGVDSVDKIGFGMINQYEMCTVAVDTNNN